jgi:signal transduction histidine kinase/Flp pilus assembly protein TadD
MVYICIVFIAKFLSPLLIEAKDMKNFLRLISVLLLCGVLFNAAQAQKQQKIDSLLNLLKTSKEDTSKVMYLNNIGNEMMYSNPDSAILLGNKARTLAEKLKWKKGISNSLGHLGRCYFLSGNYSKALDYYFKALNMSEELLDKAAIAIHLQNIGAVYSKNGDFHKALTYLFKALKMGEELGSKPIQAGSLGNIGAIYAQQEDYPKALNYLLQSLDLDRESGNKVSEAHSLYNIGNLYNLLGNLPKELDYQFQALKINEEMGDKYGTIVTLHGIGNGYTRKGKYKEAEVYLKKALAISESIGSLSFVKEFELSLSVLYQKSGRYKLALEHFEKAMNLTDTLFKQERDEQISRKEMNYEFEKKEAATKAEHDKQMAVADVEIKRQKQMKNFFIVGLAFLLILSFFVYNNFRTASKLKLQNIRNKIASDLHDDVGSTLNSISVYSEVAKQKSPAVVDELEQIGEASRKIIEVMSDIVWTINPKNDTFENIISRMSTLAYNLLKAKNIEHTFQADESLDETKLSLESRRNFYLIFKETLNNLVKYSQATRASITLTSENALVKLAVRDNGIGFDVAQTSKGNGLLNMKARAEEMKAQLKIESVKGNGTNVELIFKA